jgi:hypothetical protein
MKRPAKKKSTDEPVPVSAPANWHRRLAGVTGDLSLAVVKRSLTKGQVMAWAAILDEVRGEMDAFANRPR